MRLCCAFILLLAAQAVYSATPESFVQPFLQPGEFTYSRQANYSGHSYYVVWVNATETFVLDEAPPGTFSFVNDTSLIYGVLLRDFLNTLDVSGEIFNLNQKLAAFNASRQPAQHNCEVETGTDHAPCYDDDSCLQACLSVPACRANNPGSGGEMVHEVLLWRNNNSMVDGNLSLYSHQLQAVAGKTEQMHVEVSTAQDYLDRIFPPVAAIGTNRLFNECPMCFNLCLPIPFNTSVLNSSRSDFASIDGKLAPISNLSARSERIRELTFARTHGSAYSAMVANMTSTYGSISARVAALLPLRDSALDYNLTRLNMTLQMVMANGTAQDFDHAFALEPQFYSLATAMDGRIVELKALKDEYDAMHAEVSQALFNATANANTALSQINDPRLRESIGRLRNISDRMEALANASDMHSALALKDGFDYEDANANALIINITLDYSSLTGMKESDMQRLSDLNGKLRANYTGFRAEYANLSARFDNASALMAAPMRAEDVAPAKAELSAVAQAAAALSIRVEAQIRRDDWAALTSQIALAFRLIFFHGG